MSLEAALYDRIRGACCTEHGLSSDDALEAHIRCIVFHILALRGRASA